MNLMRIITFLCLFSVTVNMSAKVCVNSNQPLDQYSIRMGNAKLKMTKNNNEKYGIEIWSEENKLIACQPFPVILAVKSKNVSDPTGETTTLTGYDIVDKTDGGFLCQTVVDTSNGSRFKFQDEIATHNNGIFSIKRKVTVIDVGSNDEGFSSRIAFRIASEYASLNKHDFFAPGIIYRTNKYNNNGPANPNLTSRSFCFKETRFGLPMFLVHNPDNKLSLSLAHVSPQISTGIREEGADHWVINSTIEYGSVGVTLIEDLECNKVEIDYTYPSADKKYKRSHPVQKGFAHQYEISIYVSKGQCYTSAATEAYKKHFNLYDIKLFDVDMKDVYKSQLDMFAQLAGPINGGTAYGVPWSLSLPEGKPHAFELQNGFVGQQTSIAFQLMRYGLEQDQKDIFEKGLAMARFWFNDEQLIQYGLPRSWWIQGTKEDGYGNKYTGTFWSYPSFIRCATDGMEGLLDCVRLACAYNLPQKNEWMDTLCKFGEFLLVKARNEGDGSFYRAYDITGDFVRDVKVMGPSIHEQNKLQANSKTNALIPVRFLVKMYELTGDNRYYKRALAAGEYGYKAFFQDLGLFIGGTPDHSNICDKEAGVYAMYAFTSLYMMTKDKKWLEAAEYAAIFAFSHTYCYDFKIQGDEKENIFKNGGVIGQSIISVGTSDSDNYNAFIYYELFKMYILTQDPFYKKAAQLLERNTKQVMDIDKTKGYAYRALLLEASTFCDFTFSSVKAWLPWCGVANSDPIVKFYQTFGVYNISDLENKSLRKLKKALIDIGVGGKEYHIWR